MAGRLLGDGQELGVAVAGLAAGRGAGQQLAQVVERFGLAVAPDVSEQLQGQWMAELMSTIKDWRSNWSGLPFAGPVGVG